MHMLHPLNFDNINYKNRKHLKYILNWIAMNDT